MKKLMFWTRFAATVILAALFLLSLSARIWAGDRDDDWNDHDHDHFYGATSTPIEHVVVIFQENVSFDHYFATYPYAKKNLDGSVYFGKPKDDTPRVNGLLAGGLLTNNPNFNNTANAPNNINPFRLDRSQASTCDQGHNYGPEQKAFDQGLMDLFPASTGQGEGSFCNTGYAWSKGVGLVMGYYDGNTVTALWNYAQHFAMSDNSYGTTFGPSTPGVLNLVAGNTYPATPSASNAKVVPNNAGPGALVGDLDPTGDVCSLGTTVQLGGQNIGDLLNAKGVSWGSFMGGFDLTIHNQNGTTGCTRSSPASPANSSATQVDYIPHHAFFQYHPSTANPTHARPASISEIGYAGPANHNYALHDFFDVLKAGHLPAVSFLKAIGAQDGHAGYSDPLLEQSFLVKAINTIMESRYWRNTAIIVLYDDSDGWYDHQMSPIVNPSAVHTGNAGGDDALNGTGVCGHGTPFSDGSGPIQGRCGYGPRLPLLVISPYAKENFVDSTLTDQSSVLRFIEDNWETGQIGGGSYDAVAGSLNNMFDFDDQVRPEQRELLLREDTGRIKPDYDHDHDGWR
jgi:phospholipase C